MAVARAITAGILLGALGIATGGPSTLAAAPRDSNAPSGSADPRGDRSIRPSPPPPAGTTAETWDPALRAALAWLAARPSPAAHRAVAAQYARLQIRDTAYAHLTAALRLDSKNAASYDARARLWRDSGFPEQGLGDAHRARFYAPDSAEAANTLGTLFEAMGRFGEARRWYERALSIQPGAWFVLNNVCHLRTRLGEPSAVPACEAAFEVAPAPSPTVSNNLALAYAAMGDFARARARFAATVDEASAAYNMGIVYMAAGEFQQAAAEFVAAWRANPSMTLAADRLRQATAKRVTK
jgi:tetratricopeptide (TPR) repeat protein